MNKKICILYYLLRSKNWSIAENMVCQIANKLSNDFDITIINIKRP